MRKLAEDVSVSIYNSLKKYTMSIYNIYLLYIRTELPEFVFMCLCVMYLFICFYCCCMLSATSAKFITAIVHSFNISCKLFVLHQLSILCLEKNNSLTRIDI